MREEKVKDEDSVLQPFPDDPDVCPPASRKCEPIAVEGEMSLVQLHDIDFHSRQRRFQVGEADEEVADFAPVAVDIDHVEINVVCAGQARLDNERQIEVAYTL